MSSQYDVHGIQTTTHLPLLRVKGEQLRGLRLVTDTKIVLATAVRRVLLLELLLLRLEVLVVRVEVEVVVQLQSRIVDERRARRDESPLGGRLGSPLSKRMGTDRRIVARSPLILEDSTAGGA